MSLVYQWQKEIALHAPKLKVLVYDGTRQLKSPEAAGALYESTMTEFAQVDIILTTYAVLGSEVNYSKECQYSFRGAKQYAVPKSPLLDCHFHRVLLDEAQMASSRGRRQCVTAILCLC
jgi:E3 ubiquitin-protein ligase SHPRH